MLALELKREEVEVLREVLESDLAGLRMEIARTDHRAYRIELRKREALLAGILDRVTALAPLIQAAA